MRSRAVGNVPVINKLSVIALVLAVLGVGAPGSAYALSCMPPVMNESAVQAAAVIFEGVAGSRRRLSRAEAAAPDVARVIAEGGGIANLRVFEFTVTRGWKAAAKGQRIQVLRNTYWGDGFAAEESYLVFGDRRIDDFYVAPMCGHTVYLRSAVASGQLKALERLIGMGVHIKIPAGDRACRNDADCTFIQTHCGACSCGTPVARAAKAEYMALYEQACTPFKRENCEIHCNTPVPRCRQGLCVLE